MKKLLSCLSLLTALALFASPAFAGYTLFDTVKDSMFIGKGEFVSLQRTHSGDRLTFRVDEWLKGVGQQTGEVVIEPLDMAHHDVAIGQKAIVGLNLINGKYYTPFPVGGRSIFLAHENMPACESAIRGLIAINEPYNEFIQSELRKRLEYKALAFEGDFSSKPELLKAWKDELIRHTGLVASDACRDALKCFLHHDIFKGTLTHDDKARIAPNLARTSPGYRMDLNERSFMILLLREDKDLHPDMDTQFNMLLDEVADFNVGRIAELLQHQDRAEVLKRLDDIARGERANAQQRENAMQVIAALKDAKGLKTAQLLIASQHDRNKKTALKGALRRGFDALCAMPEEGNVAVLEAFMDSALGKESWEMQRRALQAFAMVDSDYTNKKLRQWYDEAPKGLARRQFLRFMLPENKGWREVVNILPEDGRDTVQQ